MIKESIIDKIRDTVVIKEVIGDFIKLQRDGHNYKACCPFHNEKSASFKVFPITNTYKCFGCSKGGDAIKFLMEYDGKTYIEAIKYLAEKYHINLEEEQESPEQVQQNKRRQDLYFANERLQEEYEKQFLDPKNAHARQYAYRRWGEEYCRQAGIGYCPAGSLFVEESNIPEDIVESLGIRSSYNHVDFFAGRITIPIRNRSRKILGFTARSMDPDAKSKYINSTNSEIYQKGDSLFGMDVAWREGLKAHKLYLVEGAPDVMRLQIIGVGNATAALGKEWTDEQLAQIWKCTQNICFIPDSDPPKGSDKFGPGIKGVLESGEKAMLKGFTVSVKQIPLEEVKQDADSYFTSSKIFSEITEVDFVEWFVDKLYSPSLPKEEQTQVIHRIAKMLVNIENATTIDLYLDMLATKGGTKRLWQKAITEERNAKKTAELKERQDKEEGLFKQFGFNIDGNHYYSVGDKGYYPWSNFRMQPLFHIKDAINPKRLFYLHNDFHAKELVELKQEDLVSLAKFKQRIEGLGNFVWLAGEKELTKLKQYLYENTETAVEISQLGWQRIEEFYAFGNGIFYRGKFIKVDEYGIIRLQDKGNFYLPAFSKIYFNEPRLFVFERKFIHDPQSAVSLREFTDQMFTVFGDNGRVGFCFLLASLFRDIVVAETRSFAILNLFGPKGSGKSELGHTLMSFFVANNVPPNIENSTIAALNDSVAAVSNALVHIDEFKNDIDLFKREFLKGLWDGTGRTRKNMDLDKKAVTTSVDCGVILSGQEMATADIALFSRLIFLTFPRSEFSSEEKREYIKIKRMRSLGLTHLTLDILDFRNKVEQNFHNVYTQTFDDITEALVDDHIEDRILSNWVAPLTMIRILESTLNINLSYRDMLKISINGIKTQNAECRQNNELGAFWKMVQFLASEGELIEGGDYRIQYTRQFKSSLANLNWNYTHPVLYIQKSRIFMLYKKHGKNVGDTVLPESSLKYYLETSKPYLGEKPCRFNVYHKGVLQLDPVKTNANGYPSKLSTTQRCYCFDYDKLKGFFGLNLERGVEDLDEEVSEPKPDLQETIDFSEPSEQDI